jgi:glycosyltransferase involved in cell wall biosynthesis
MGGFSLHWVPYALGMRDTLAFGMGIPSNIKRAPWTILQAVPLYLGFVWQAWLLRSKISLIHAQWISTLPSATIASLLTRKPLVVTLRGSDRLFVRNRPIRSLVRILLKQASLVTAVSESLRNEFSESLGLPKSQLITIANGVAVDYPSQEDLEDLTERFPYFRTPTIVYVGRVIPLKRVEHLIDLLNAPGFSSYQLVLVGRCDSLDYLASLQDRAVSLGVRARVHIVGPVEPKTIPAIMVSATCIASMSSSEGRPNSLVEALRLGCIVLASKIPPHLELITDQQNGLLFDPDQLGVEAPKILSLLGDANAILSMRNNARKSVGEFSWEDTARQYVAVYHQVTALGETT